jgi:hypothetical protein
MNKLLIGGAAGVLLIAGQAIAARLPDMVAARVAEPAVATAVTADPAVMPAARRAAPVVVTSELALSPVADRLDPVAAIDPAGVAGVGPLTEAETARLAVAQSVDPSSSGGAFNGLACASLWMSADDTYDAKCDGETGSGRNPTPSQTRLQLVPIGATAIIATTAIVVATDDDSDS